MDNADFPWLLRTHKMALLGDYSGDGRLDMLVTERGASLGVTRFIIGDMNAGGPVVWNLAGTMPGNDWMVV